jgi:hypothetical protein
VTIRDLIDFLGQHPLILLAIFAAPPLLALVLGRLLGRERAGETPWKYVFAVLVYLVCIPGMLAAVLTAYTLFFTRENLLDVNVLVYLLPLLSMAVSLMLISSAVGFERVPGFQRLSGLMLLLATTFVILLFVSKTRIWLVFAGSFLNLAVLAVAVFALLKWGVHMAMGRKKEPIA